MKKSDLSDGGALVAEEMGMVDDIRFVFYFLLVRFKISVTSLKLTELCHVGQLNGVNYISRSFSKLRD